MLNAEAIYRREKSHHSKFFVRYSIVKQVNAGLLYGSPLTGVKRILAERWEVGHNRLAAWRLTDFSRAVRTGKAINLCYSAPVKEFYP
jgi:hypothetical protein